MSGNAIYTNNDIEIVIDLPSRGRDRPSEDCDSGVARSPVIPVFPVK